MLIVKYNFRTLQPLHTGSDEFLGMFRSTRRAKFVVNSPGVYRTRFTAEQDRLRRQAAALMLMRLWDKMDNTNRPGIYEQVASKLLVAAASRSKVEFLQRIAVLLEIREVTYGVQRIMDPVDILELFDDYEFLNLIRQESQYIMAYFTKLKDARWAWVRERKTKAAVATETVLGDTPELDEAPDRPDTIIQKALLDVYDQPMRTIERTSAIEHVPVIGGNSIRGVLRRQLMADFLRQVGVTSLSPSIYHRLFTGGMLNEKSKGMEEIGTRRQVAEMLPPIALLGSAWGSMIIQGSLIVSEAQLHCKELATGSHSHHDLTEILFATRHDSSKLERDIEIVQSTAAADPSQMFYQTECISTGAEFSHAFNCTSPSPLIQSCFWRMLKLFVEKPYVGGKSNTGMGQLDLAELAAQIPADGDALYLQHLATNAEAIRAYLSDLSNPTAEADDDAEGGKKKGKKKAETAEA